MVLHREFVVALRQTEEQIGKAIASVRPIVTRKAECTLSRAEQVLDFLVDCPAAAKLKLMRAVGPGNIVADLVVVRFVHPGPAGDLEVRAALAVEGNVGNARQIVRTGEQTRTGAVVTAREREARQAVSCKRNDVNAVAVVVERHFVQQRRADRMCCMHNSAAGGVAEGIANGWNVIAAPLCDGVALRDLFGNEVAEHGEFAGEVVIDADHFFLEARRDTRAARERSGPTANVSQASARENAGCE